MESYRERRRGAEPVPDRVEKLLTDLQLMTLRQLDCFGWQLSFVRRPLFQDVTAYVTDTSGHRIGLLDAEGLVKYDIAESLRA